MSLMRINPLRELENVNNLMSRFFGDSMSRLFGEEQSFTGGTWTPAVDIHETEDELTFTYEVPGFEKDQVNITVSEGRLIVSGERKAEEQKDRKYHHIERWRGSFYRSFLLPTSVETDKISANLKNGLLTVVLPKKAESKPRQIQVSVQ